MHSAENTGKVPDSKGFLGRQKQIRNTVDYFCRELCL